MKKLFLAILAVTLIGAISCSTFVDRELKYASILKAEYERNGESLFGIASLLQKNDVEIAQRAAIASGRIPSFKSWMALADTFKNNQAVTDSLAVSMRFPGTDFDKKKVFQALSSFTQSTEVAESYLHLNTKEAFEKALTCKNHMDAVAFNLWRSGELFTEELAKQFYDSHKEAVIYSLYRARHLKDSGIVKAEDLKSMDLSNRVYGTLVCDNPEAMLEDADWQVRVSALKAANSQDSAEKLLNDENPLVKETAIGIYLKNEGKPTDIDLDSLTPVQAEIVAEYDKGKNTVLGRIFDKGDLFAEVSAPFYSKTKKDFIMEQDISTKSKILYLENIEEKAEAVELAKDSFLNDNDIFSLIYLIDSKEEFDKDSIIKSAMEKGGVFLSILEDYSEIREKYSLKTHTHSEKELGYYVKLMDRIKKVKGFEIVTEKGAITCSFFHDQAPMTCLNTIDLIEKDYYKKLNFHRVVPAFVAQDGDPTGTGAGGPGYAIRCEYNGLRYDTKGRVGMALAGKDTGGSQYFLIHQPTPHLNHSYTIFAQMDSGSEVLDILARYDKITELKLIMADGQTTHNTHSEASEDKSHH